jgi:hypothetical protein
MTTYGARRYFRHADEVRVRTGICCGVYCKRYASRRGKDVTLHRADENGDRWRCRDCFKQERGYFP